MSQPAASAPTGPDYSKSLYLPQTAFPMRAGLPKKEPELLAHWAAIDLYGQLRQAGQGRPKLVLHDGPPYANGNIHIGHALNKILKDLVTRSAQMTGFDSNYVPGWDCHGLPIEWKIEEEYRAKGRNKDDVPVVEFRRQCREFARRWVDIQREEFKRLGVTGDWANPYETMSYAAEAQIAREIMAFAANGLLYRGSKPVMWSVVEKTALAEAEVEYEDYVSDTVYVAFPLRPLSHFGLSRSYNSEISAEDNARRNTEYSDSWWERLGRASIVIWTTTPWTLPANRAITYSSHLNYIIVTPAEPNTSRELPILVSDLTDDEREHVKISGASSPESYTHLLTEIEHARRDYRDRFGRRCFVVAESRFDDFCKVIKVPTHVFGSREQFDVNNFRSMLAAHPLAALGYGFDVPLLDGDHVTDDTGTGFVHTAPSHGRDDFDVWTANTRQLQARGIDTRIPYTVDADGFLTADAPGFVGRRVLDDKGAKGDANEAVIAALVAAGALVARGRLKHQYPHSWRSKKPLIFRNTPQWFIALDKPFTPAMKSDAYLLNEQSSLRTVALDEIARTRWVPAAGENRITGMIANRPDWVVSRQRAWGVPIAIFVNSAHEPLVDAAVNARILAAFADEGADAWYADGARERFLGSRANEDWQKVDDILDVWFDSGSTHSFTLENNPAFPGLAGIHRKRDGGRDEILYLEGSDQHRGWFHSSLLESCGTRGRAPYDAVLTHGFVLDEHGHKMSKSKGNVTAPQSVIKDSGADILRLWVAAADYADDLRIGPEILKTFVETYKKLRNTLRWMLGTLAHHDPAEAADLTQADELERLMLHHLAMLDDDIRDAYEKFDYKRVVARLALFLNADCSAFYFDIRKDALYCDAPSSGRRRMALATIEHIFRAVTLWLAPILAFTAEEAWMSRYPDAVSVHLESFPVLPPEWRNPTLAADWDVIRAVRSVVTGALEIARANKLIGSSLAAKPTVFIEGRAIRDILDRTPFADICITSDISLVDGESPADAFRLPDVEGVAVVVHQAEGAKCARSWKISPLVGSDPEFPDVTPRDAAALRELRAAGLWA